MHITPQRLLYTSAQESMVSAHNKTFFFFFFTRAEQKKKKETLVMLFDESCTSSAMKATTRDVLFYHPPSCRWFENVRVRNQSGRFHKTKTKKQQKGVRFPLSRWNYTCFSSQLCFCLHAASFYFKYVTHRRLNASEKSSNYSVRVWKSPFECRSPALCGFTRGHFSVFW